MEKERTGIPIEIFIDMVKSLGNTMVNEIIPKAIDKIEEKIHNDIFYRNLIEGTADKFTNFINKMGTKISFYLENKINNTLPADDKKLAQDAEKLALNLIKNNSTWNKLSQKERKLILTSSLFSKALLEENEKLKTENLKLKIENLPHALDKITEKLSKEIAKRINNIPVHKKHNFGLLFLAILLIMTLYFYIKDIYEKHNIKIKGKISPNKTITLIVIFGLSIAADMGIIFSKKPIIRYISFGIDFLFAAYVSYYTYNFKEKNVILDEGVKLFTALLLLKLTIDYVIIEIIKRLRD